MANDDWRIGPWSEFIIKDYDYSSSVDELGLAWMSNLNSEVPANATMHPKETRRIQTEMVQTPVLSMTVFQIGGDTIMTK